MSTNQDDGSFNGSNNFKKFSKRSFLKFAGSLSGVVGAAGAVPSSVKAGGAFVLFQTLFRVPNAEAQTWQKLQVGPPKLKVRTPQRNQKLVRNVVAAGSSHTVALRADGAVFATGGNFYGQLGDNTAVDKRTFVSSI